MTDINIVTFNRLPYLKYCIASILMSSPKIKYNINVIDDMSTDGTVKWLQAQQKRGNINRLILNTHKLGTANNFNKIIDSGTGDWFVMANDDMWFHKGWDTACHRTIADYPDCGIISLFNYTRLKEDKKLNPKSVDLVASDMYKVWNTGLGAAMVSSELYKAAGKFKLPKGKVMGFFASKFCQRARATRLKRNQIYIPCDPVDKFYVTHFDHPSHPLSDRDYTNANGYGDLRRVSKGKPNDPPPK